MTRRCLSLVAALALAASATLVAQGPPGRGGGPPPTPRAAAPVDFTGNWVSIVSEDWRWRMITPPKGDYANIPVNAEARRVGDTWDPAKDEAAGEQCRAYAAPAIMREPGRLRISWQDDTTLKIETDAGQQTRLFHFGGRPPEGGMPSWQGYRWLDGKLRRERRLEAESRSASVRAPARTTARSRYRRPRFDPGISARTACRSAHRPPSRSISICSRIRTALTGSS